MAPVRQVVVASSVLVVLLLGGRSSGEECVPVPGILSSCVCKTSRGIVDLRPLASTDGTPKFLDVHGVNGFHYSYNPCIAFTYGSCKDAYICQWTDDRKSGFSIADNGTETFGTSVNGTVSVKYTSDNPVATGATIELYCDQDVAAERSALISKGSLAFAFSFELTSCQVCPGGCRSRRGNIAGIIGIVLIFLVIVGVLVYCVGGAIFLRVRKSDNADVIPNQKFWESLPSLIKDGCKFIISPCMKLRRGKDGYNEI